MTSPRCVPAYQLPVRVIRNGEGDFLGREEGRAEAKNPPRMRYSTSMLTTASVTWSVPGTTRQARAFAEQVYVAVVEVPEGLSPDVVI